MSNNSATGIYRPLITTIDPLLEKFEIGKMIYAAYGNQNFNAAMLIRTLTSSQSVPTSQVNFYHFEDQPLNQGLLTAAGGPYTGAAGAAVTVTLNTSNLSTIDSLLPVRAKWTIIDPNNNSRQYYIVSVNHVTPSITIAPMDSTVAISISGGIWLKIGASAMGQGSGQPGGILTPVVKKTGYTQILKEGLVYSGTAATDEASVDMISVGGVLKRANVAIPPGLGNTYVLRTAMEMEFRMTNQFADVFYEGEPNTNTSVVTDSDPLALNGAITTTYGLNRQATLFGGSVPYSIGGMTMTYFKQKSDFYASQYVDSNRCIMDIEGKDVYDEKESLLTANNYNTAIKYDQDKANGLVYGVETGGTGKMYNFGFVGVHISGYDNISMREPLFNDPNGLGLPGYNWRYRCYSVPLAPGKDPVNKVPMETVTMRYKSLGGENRAFKTWFRGQEITNYDQSDVNMQADIAWEWFGMNRVCKSQGS